MDFMTPPMFDILYFQNWKVKMFIYLKALGIHVYFTTIKNSYFINGKHLEVNTKAIHALKSTLNDEYLFQISNFDLTFVVWNTIVFLANKSNTMWGADDGTDAFNICYMVQGDNPLEVNSESELDKDVDMSY